MVKKRPADSAAREAAGHDAIRHRKILLKDGRYMIFYTFEGKLERTEKKTVESARPDTKPNV